MIYKYTYSNYMIQYDMCSHACKQAHSLTRTHAYTHTHTHTHTHAHTQTQTHKTHELYV